MQTAIDSIFRLDWVTGGAVQINKGFVSDALKANDGTLAFTELIDQDKNTRNIRLNLMTQNEIVALTDFFASEGDFFFTPTHLVYSELKQNQLRTLGWKY